MIKGTFLCLFNPLNPDVIFIEIYKKKMPFTKINTYKFENH